MEQLIGQLLGSPKKNACLEEGRDDPRFMTVQEPHTEHRVLVANLSVPSSNNFAALLTHAVDMFGLVIPYEKGEGGWKVGHVRRARVLCSQLKPKSGARTNPMQGTSPAAAEINPGASKTCIARDKDAALLYLDRLCYLCWDLPTSSTPARYHLLMLISVPECYSRFSRRSLVALDGSSLHFQSPARGKTPVPRSGMAGSGAGRLGSKVRLSKWVERLQDARCEMFRHQLASAHFQILRLTTIPQLGHRRRPSSAAQYESGHRPSPVPSTVPSTW
ncbi:hypothetical protein BX600DRAFT_308825 [Xylariales sp. PMI_506]|nr:hypothetical protein BX600DRAFT_308825 [Xylariales sp. PMI_506]